MADNDNTATKEASSQTAASKTVYEDVKMTDGRTVKFPGKRQIDKTVVTDDEGNKVAVRFDFRNGETLTLSSDELDEHTKLLCLGHGMSQKCGDEAAGEKDIDDIVVAVGDMMGRLRQGEWKVERAAGDSFAGAGIVIKAVMEVTGKTIDEVKAFLQKKLDASKKAAEESGGKVKPLTRADLYASFRSPDSKTGIVIARLEAEKAAKGQKVNSDELLEELKADEAEVTA